jgi:hypothetical protein
MLTPLALTNSTVSVIYYILIRKIERKQLELTGGQYGGRRIGSQAFGYRNSGV